MRKPILPPGGQHGSNPLERRAMLFRELLETRGQCETTWNAQDKDPEHPVHRCCRYQRHGAQHKCGCGTTRKMALKPLIRR
jgi:hypothetical protein